MNKILPLSEAVAKYVKSGASLGFAGSGGRLSIAFAYEVIKQEKGDLSFVSAGTGAPCLDLLVGAKLVKRAEISFTMVTCLNIKRAVEGKKSRKDYRLLIEDYSNLAMSLRFFAGATKIPFIPIRSLAGSDLEKIRTFMGKEKMATMRSPFKDGTKVTVLPPSIPDVAVMHAQCADEEGNILALGPAGSDGWLLRAAKKRIVTVEKIVSKQYVKEHNVYTFLPGFMTDAVCEVPYGAHPYGLVDCYDLDAPFQKEFNTKSKTQEGFDEWAKEWVFGIYSRSDYLEKVGKETIARITNPKFAEDRLFE
ncbi:MAG: CoA transferase subunit A [Nitrososphaerota archaeon]|nr:CoA transferase subunit A [Nitrososphaerota archaeon]